MNIRMTTAATITLCLVFGFCYAFGSEGKFSYSQLGKQIEAPHRPATRDSRITAPPEVMARIQALSRQGHELEEQARTQMRTGDLAGAEQSARQAITFYEAYRPDLHIVLIPVAAAQRQLLGDIYLKEGRYQTALETYGIVGKYTHGEGAIVGPTLNLNVALAYCGLGDYKTARHYYSDKAITQYSFGGKSVDPADLPGADSPQALVASIHLARGIDSYFHEENADAANDFAAAGQITPNNPLLNYYWSDALIRLHRYSEAAPHAEIANKHGHGPLPEFAVTKVNQASLGMVFLSQHPNYYAQHPEEAPKPLK